MMIMFPGNVAASTQLTGTPEHVTKVKKMMEYNEALQKAGVLLALDGLHPATKGARVRVAAGKKSITDGPFTEAKEIVGGYWIIQVRSREEALEWAKRIPLENEDPDAFVEVRQIYDMADFPAEVRKIAEPLVEARK
jgi:hypothetical protein